MDVEQDRMSTRHDSDNGPLSVWQMFNAPTISLFTNPAQSQDGLEALLFSIVNSSRDFPEVLVHREGSVCPVEYYEAFNQWLLGRIIYVLSIEELHKIHNLSVNAQLKILGILYFNEVTFFQSFVQNYVNVLEDVINYNQGYKEGETLTLDQFKVNSVDALNKKLDLSSLFIQIQDKGSSESMMVHIMNILSGIFGITLGRAAKDNFWSDILKKFLYIMENFQMELKLQCFRYFIEIIEKLGYPMFVYQYEEIFINFIIISEEITSKVIISSRTSIENAKLLEACSILLKSLLTNISASLLYHKRIRDRAANISMLLLKQANSTKLDGTLPVISLSEDLKAVVRNCLAHCLESGSSIKFDIFPSNINIVELAPIITSKITKEICNYLRSLENKDMNEDKTVNVSSVGQLYESVIKILLCTLKAASDDTINDFVVKTHLETICSILNIIQTVKYKQQLFVSTAHEKHEHVEKIKFTYFDDNIISNIFKYLEMIFKIHIQACTAPISLISLVLKSLSAFLNILSVLSVTNMKILLDLSTYPWDLGSVNMHQFQARIKESDEYMIISMNALVEQCFLLNDKKAKDNWKQVCLKLLATKSTKSKALQILIINQSPLLLINDILSPSLMISEYWHPALLSRCPELLNNIVSTLPSIICILADKYDLVQEQSKIDTKGVALLTINGLQVNLNCSICQDNSKPTSVVLRKFDRDAQNDSILISMKSLLEKFLNVGMYTNVPNVDLTQIILAFSKHSVFPLTAQEYLCSKKLSVETISALKYLISSILANNNISDVEQSNTLKAVFTFLLNSSNSSLQSNNRAEQNLCLEAIKELGLIESEKVLLMSTRLLLYFIIHPHCTLGSKAAIYIVMICERHKSPPNKVFQKYKNDYCRTMMLLVAFNVLNKRGFAASILKVARAFGYIGFRDFVSKEMDYTLPFLIPLIVKTSHLKPIMDEISSLVNSTPAELLTKHFPDLYPNIYMNEDDSSATKCFKHIEKTTGIPLVIHVKKHFRVILAEILLQYCTNPEKVIKACKWLSQNDPEYTLADPENINLEDIASFLQPRFLGVLAYFDNKLVNARVPLSSKRKALQSLPDIMKLMGPENMTPLRFKIMTTLRTALTKEFPKLNALAWNAFIHNVDTITLGPLLTTIFVSLMPLLPNAANEINKIFHYLVINNENLLSANIPDLFFLENTLVSERVKYIVKRHLQRVQSDSFIEKLNWYLPHLSQDCGKLRLYTLDSLNKILQLSRKEVDHAIFGEKQIHPHIVNLLDSLIAACSDSDERLRLSGGRCLGQLGAIEPGHLPRRYVSPDSAPFAFSIDEDHFASASLTELTRAFQVGKYSKNIDCYALAIQEILKLYEISPSGERKHVWESFSNQVHQVMTPLLSSRYTLNCRLTPVEIYPIFGSHLSVTFADWIYIWSGQLVCMVSDEVIFEMLQTVHPSMKRDQRILQCFMPYVLLHAILNSNNTQLIANEIAAVIGLESFNQERRKNIDIPDRRVLRSISMTPKIIHFVAEEGTQMKCAKLVYGLLDFLGRWLREWLYNKKNPLLEDNYKKIDSFMEQFCKLTIAKGNFMCGDFERSLLYLELFIDESQERLQDQLSFLAQIYSVLDEPDCVAGIMSMKSDEPSIMELILAHEVTGRPQDAATCYERLLQDESLDDRGLQGMVECYLDLDQPFTAHRLLLDQKDLLDGCEDGYIGLAAEPLWRLGMFDELDKLLEKSKPPQRSWGILIGHALLAYRSRDATELPSRLDEARLLLLSRMGGLASNTNTTAEDGVLRRCYPAVLGLHIITEIELANNLLNTLSELPDADSSAESILETFLTDWNLRLQVVQSSVRTVEPLLRMRRILLEQSKSLLESTRSQTASLLNVPIGNLWLQSAKYARKAGIFQQAYIYLLNAEKYNPDCLFIQNAKLNWARGQQESAFTTLKRGLEEKFSNIESLNQQQSKICAKAKLLIAVYNDETTNVDLDVNISHYKEAVEVYRQWEKSLVCLAGYYERVITNANPNTHNLNGIRVHALNCYGRALLYGHRYLYQSMPRMLSIWLDFEVQPSDPNSMSVLTQMCSVIETFVERLPLHLFLTAFSQIVSRICHPVKEVYTQLRAIIVKLIVAYPQHSLWMMMCVIKSSYPQRNKRCSEVLSDPRLKEPLMLKLIYDFNQLAEKLIELCNKPIAGNPHSASVNSLVRTLPRLLKSDNFSHIMMPFEQFCKIVLPTRSNDQVKTDLSSFTEPLVYIADVEDRITILPSLQKPRKVTLKGSDGKSYVIMLKPRDDLRKDFRLMEFNSVVNRYLQENPEARSRRLYIRTYSVLPLNEECGLIQWVNNLVGFRPILIHIYKQKGIFTSNRELRELMCQNKDPLSKKKALFEEKLLPRHPPVFAEWFRRTFSDPYCWYQARSAYIRTTAVMSMVGYILGLGDRHGENVLFDSTNGDTVHVDFNCLFNKGEAFEWPERVPFRLTHNMESAMGPLGREGMFRKSCEVTMRVLRAQTVPLLSVVRPFLYDPLVSWGKASRPQSIAQPAERTNERAKEDLTHIEQRLQGMVRTKTKQCSLSLSAEGQVNDLITEATSVMNLCQMYIGWGPFI